MDDFYCSPLGRARDTAYCTLKKMNRKAKILSWTQEFNYPIDDPVTGRHGVPWDLVPSSWCNDILMLSKDGWVQSDIMSQNPDIAVHYQDVCKQLDQFLEKYGYVREDNFYRVPGKGQAARSIRLDLPKFTLIGATTRAGLLTAPLRDRFGIIHRLEFYTPEELQQIILHSSQTGLQDLL